MLRMTATKMRAMAAVMTLAGLSGCATLTESTQQTVMVQTIQDNREIVNVGCVLTNNVGRWFVMAPGRVTIQKSAGQLWIDCRKEGVGIGHDVAASRNTCMWGNVAISAGLGYYVDRNTGAGFDYPSTLTVLMRNTSDGAPLAPQSTNGTVLF